MSGDREPRTHAVTRRIRAPRAAVYAALLDPRAVQTWRVPDGMRSVVHEFDAREGGRFRVSLTYDDASTAGKSGGHSDTYGGTFARLIDDREVVEAIAFETDDPALAGEMTVRTTLADAADGQTELTMTFAGLPAGVSQSDNELGTRMALDRLAALLESEESA